MNVEPLQVDVLCPNVVGVGATDTVNKNGLRAVHAPGEPVAVGVTLYTAVNILDELLTRLPFRLDWFTRAEPPDRPPACVGIAHE